MTEHSVPHPSWEDREKHFHSFYQTEIDAGSTCVDHILKSALIGKIFYKDDFTEVITWVYTGFVSDENELLEPGMVLYFEESDTHIFVGDNEFFRII